MAKIELVVGDGSYEIAAASLPVRWCIDKQTLSEFKELKVNNPHILLVIVTRDSHGRIKKEKRTLISMKKEMEYLSFDSSGVNYIYAFIVSHSNGNENKLWDYYMSRGRNSYNSDIFNHWITADDDSGLTECNDYDLNRHSIKQHCFTKTVVEIPEELFAVRKEWLVEWVNYWFSNKAIDECSFNKRLPLAFTIQPIALFLWAVLLIITRVALAIGMLSCGLRRTTLSPILHPFKQTAYMMWWSCHKRGSVFLPERNGRKMLFYLPASPGFWIICFVILFGLNYLVPSSTEGSGLNTVSSWQAISMFSIMSAVVLFLFVKIEIFSSFIMKKMPDLGFDAFDIKKHIAKLFGVSRDQKFARWAAKSKANQDAHDKKIETSLEGLDILVCETISHENMRAEISALSPSRHFNVHKHVVLRFKAVKAHFCKPFTA